MRSGDDEPTTGELPKWVNLYPLIKKCLDAINTAMAEHGIGKALAVHLGNTTSIPARRIKKALELRRPCGGAFFVLNKLKPCRQMTMPETATPHVEMTYLHGLSELKRLEEPWVANGEPEHVAMVLRLPLAPMRLCEATG